VTGRLAGLRGYRVGVRAGRRRVFPCQRARSRGRARRVSAAERGRLQIVLLYIQLSPPACPDTAPTSDPACPRVLHPRGACRRRRARQGGSCRRCFCLRRPPLSGDRAGSLAALPSSLLPPLHPCRSFRSITLGASYGGSPRGSGEHARRGGRARARARQAWGRCCCTLLSCGAGAQCCCTLLSSRLKENRPFRAG
jgi:hypothetical protein